MPLTTVRSSAWSSSRASATARQLRDDQCHNHDAGAVVFRPLEHDPEKWVPVFPRDKREAFARRSCSNKKIERYDDSKKSHPALAIPPMCHCTPGSLEIPVRSFHSCLRTRPLARRENDGLNFAPAHIHGARHLDIGKTPPWVLPPWRASPSGGGFAAAGRHRGEAKPDSPGQRGAKKAFDLVLRLTF